MSLRTVIPTLLLAGALGLPAPWQREARAVQLPAPGRGLVRGPTQQTCPDGRISVVFLDNRSVFDTSDPELQGRLLWFFKLANTLHVDTRRSFIRRELLFAEGDCMEPLLLRESERLLREHPFIARADIFSLVQPDGTRHVVVDTQDEWTTQLDLGLTFDEGLQLEVVELTEENFLGRGMLVEFSFEERREQRDFGFRVADPQLLGTRWDGEVTLGRTRVGNEWSETVIFPFVAEVGQAAVRHRMGRREAIFAYTTRESEFTHLVLPVDKKFFELTGARRFGEPGDFLVLGGGVSRESQVLGDFPSSVKGVREADFGNLLEVSDSVGGSVADQAAELSATRLNLILGLRRILFEPRMGLDPLRGVQDVPVGWRAALTVGKSVDILGEGEVEPTNDLFTRLDLFGGSAPGPWVLAGGLQMEGRRVIDQDRSGDGWHDLLGEVKLFAYLQPESLSGHTFFGQATFTSGWATVTPFQLTLGGRRGIRGFGEDDFPGGRRVLMHLEDRIYLNWPAPKLLDFGLTFFADGGAIWPGDVPFGGASGLKGAVGGGLRVGFPAGTRSVIRLDLAFPLGGGGLSDGPVFRVTMLELLGFRGGLADIQLARSRQANIDTEFRSVSR